MLTTLAPAATAASTAVIKSSNDAERAMERRMVAFGAMA